MSRRSEIQVGLTVLVALAILLASLTWLKDWTLARDKRVWLVEFPEAGGLAASDEVQVNGMRKGDVLSAKLVGDKVRVELNLSKEITITRDSRVSIRNVGMMGEKVIAVDLRASGTPYRPGEVIPGVYEQGMTEVMSSVGQTVETVTRLSRRLDAMTELLEREGRLSNTVQNFNRTSEELRLAVSENRAAMHETFKNFAAVSRTAKALTTDREAQLAHTLDRFAAAAERINDLTTRLDSLRATIQIVSTRVERGEGTLGKLVNDDQLYADLNTSVKSLQALIEDIKAHPRKYLKFSIF